MKSKIGLVLSGGGARGIGHLAVLKVLEECEIRPDVISGTSAGALIGALYSNGYSVKDILHLAKRTRIFGFPHVGSPGLFTMKAFESALLKAMPHDSFDDLRIPLSVAVTDVVNGESLYFSEGKLSTALMASACVPLLFSPVETKGTLLVDGGILDNFPTGPMEGKVDTIIGSHVNSISKKIENLHLKDILDRTFHIALGQSVFKKASKCAVFFDPPEMSQFGLFDMHQADQIYGYAYDYAVAFKGRLKLIDSAKQAETALTSLG